MKQALASPIGSPPLREIIRRKKAKNAVVVVNDITRPTPYHVYLPALEEELQEVDEVTASSWPRAFTGATPMSENLAIFGDYPAGTASSTTMATVTWSIWDDCPTGAPCM